MAGQEEDPGDRWRSLVYRGVCACACPWLTDDRTLPGSMASFLDAIVLVEKLRGDHLRQHIQSMEDEYKVTEDKRYAELQPHLLRDPSGVSLSLSVCV